MAYQLWRVFMKKYTKVRIGLHKATHQTNAVTPSTLQCDSFDEESWKPTCDDPTLNTRLSRTNDTRQSTSKRVKTYLKKCKNSLGRSASTDKHKSPNNPENPPDSSNEPCHASWYVTDDVSMSSSNYTEESNHLNSRKSRTDSICSEVKFASIQDSTEIFEDAVEFHSGSFVSGAFEVELVDNFGGQRGRCPSETSEIVKVDDFAEFDERDESIMDLGKGSAGGGDSLHGSTLLFDLQMRKDDDNSRDESEETEKEATLDVDKLVDVGKAKAAENCTDVASLVESYFGELYSNFANTRKILVRQARDLLVCEYFGCLQRFEDDFCRPASVLLQFVKDNYSSNSCTPRGWPICLGTTGILIHLGAILCPTRLQNGDGYLCVKKTTSLNPNSKYANKSTSQIASSKSNRPKTLYEPSSTEDLFRLCTAKTVGDLVSKQSDVDDSANGLVQLVLIYRDNQGLVQRRSLVEYYEGTDDVRVNETGLNSSMDLDRVRMCDGKELVQMLQNLVVSIEQHDLRQIPLDDLIYPCSHCLDYLPLVDSNSPTSSSNTLDESSTIPPCSCQCAHGMAAGGMHIQTKDTGMQTTGGLFEVDVIPHIDSDEDEQLQRGGQVLEEGKCGTSTITNSTEDTQKSTDSTSTASTSSSRKAAELPIPTRISDIPEKLLMSGINLPGTHDVNGRPLILCFAECISRSGLNKYEIARLFLYYNTIPDREELRDGFTTLLLAESDQDNNVLELIDKAAILVANHISIARIIIWKPGINPKHKNLSSRIQAVTVSDPTTLSHYIHPTQTSTIITASFPSIPTTSPTTTPPALPSSATSSTAVQHDQLEWVEFYRQLEPFQADCRRVGRGLLTHLAHVRLDDGSQGCTDLGDGERCWRGIVAFQCRQQLFSSTPLYASLTALRKSGPSTLTALGDRAQWLKGSTHVQRAFTQASETYNMTDRVAQRVQQLEQERKERIRELRRMKVMREEATELLVWISNFGEHNLKENFLNLRATLDLAAVKDIEKTFETFHFEAMRHIDKSNDLIDECTNLRDFKTYNFKDTTESLKTSVKSFTDRLEHLRESIENTTRCFQLLEDCESLESNRANEEDFDRIFCELALKSGNDKLIQVSNHPRDRDKSPPNFTSTPIKQPATRRRSVSSQAFIYKCNHRADGINCTCKDTEDDDLEATVSYQLKKQFLQMDQKKSDFNSSDSYHLKKQFLLNSAKNSSSSSNSPSDKSAIKDRCVVERKVSATLDGIKEVRESVENLLLDGDVGTMCDSGVSTGENSVGDDKVVGCCSCDSSVGEDRENFEKSDDIDDQFDSRKVPPIPSNTHLYYHPSIEGDSTTDTKTQKTLLYIMREMIQTERDYVASLDYIIINYIPELTREDIPQALRGQRNVVFGNVEKIYEFHSQYFLRELEQYELCPLEVGQIFLKYQSHFALYALYNKNKPKSDSLMSEFGSKFFKSKQLQINDLMDLASYLLKPVQRMGKYALLLQQMLKACPKLYSSTSNSSSDQENQEQEHTQESEDLIKHIREAEEMVRFQLRHGNDLLAMDSIRECDVNLKEQGALIRQNEFMVLEGRTGKKTMRQVFLFEELILFSKARRLPDRKNLDLYIYKNSIKTADIGLTAKIGDSSTRFEIWFRKRKPNDTYILQASSEDVKKAWTEELSQLLWKQAITNKEVRQQEMSSMGIGNKPCLEIRPSVNQISDRSISYDQLSRTAPKFRNSISGPSVSTTDLSSSTLMHTAINTLPSSSSSSSSTTSSSNHSLSNCTERLLRNTSTLSNPAQSNPNNKMIQTLVTSPNASHNVMFRPHSVISMSSSTGSSSSGGSSSCSRGGADSSSGGSGSRMTRAIDDVGSAKGCGTTTRSGTLNSQCSIESGIIADMSHDDCSESARWSLEKSQQAINDDMSNETTTEL